MKRSVNTINNILSIIFLLGTIFLVTYTCSQRYYFDVKGVILPFIGYALLSALINAFFHELGHLIVGKINGFKVSAFCVWFFCWKRVGKKIKFKFVLPTEEAGFTELIPTKEEKIGKKYMKMSLGGPIVSFFMMLIGIVPFIINDLPINIFILLGVFLPVGAYYFFNNILPMSSMGVRNDGATAYGLYKMDNESIVTENLLKIQAQMYNGKTPGEVSENLYFDLPQLPEDSPTFIMLLSARLSYYIDKEDFVNAKKTSDRILTLYDYMPKAVRNAMSTEALYLECVYTKNGKMADELMYELEKYLNNNNSASNIRAKLAYLLYIVNEKQGADIFYKKGVKEAKKSQIKGQTAYEIKLLDKLKADF